MRKNHLSAEEREAPAPKLGGKDALFGEERGRIDDFDFGEKTAAVFDDMRRLPGLVGQHRRG